MNRSISRLGVGFVLVLIGCGSSESRTVPSSSGGTAPGVGGGDTVIAGGASACSPGTERCDCYGNHTCNDGLECRSDLCVAANGGSTSAGGTTSSGGVSSGGDSSSGGWQSGGTENTAGGTEAQAGATATGGIAGIGGTAESAGGTTMGGADTGGLSSAGGTGNAVNGGSQAVGGSYGTGGLLAIGGVSTGGQSSTGGTLSGATCGNGIVEAGESCDVLPKNNDLGDGCTPDCKAEPNCPAAGGPCTSKCGDGLVMGSEACDDGNAVGGDGCSADCSIETGFECSQPPLGDTMSVPMVVRDFNAGGDFEKGSGFSGLNYATQGLLQETLDARGLKPVLVSTTGTYNGTSGRTSGIASAASFAQWYDDAAQPAGNVYRATLARSLTLYLNQDRTAYVNRFGTNGDGANSTQYVRKSLPGTYFCGLVGSEDHDALGNPIPCTYCVFDEDPSTPQCDPGPYQTRCRDFPNYVECAVSNGYYYGIYVEAAFDGNPLFFPADVLKPFSPSTTAQISGNYDPSWPSDPSGMQRNFSFTTEVRFWFQYDGSKPYQLSFVGDDDVWVFINKRLAVDLGGIHTAVMGTVSIEADTGLTTVTVTPTNITPAPAPIKSHPDLGLEPGNIYEIAIFHAERQTKASSYQLSLAGFNTAPSVCTRKN